ncbi:hypothetical protein QE152_g40126 [Popillia japonica]|uniref:Retrotransposon gag domain-containing protein n=1 Tax=Popillia japonica TaxID=7064 RepID=A0AAW1HS53_POPJA
MDVNCLKSTEVEYEIKIRGVTPSGDLDFKRKTLRGLLTQERGNRSFFTIVNPLVFSEDEKDARESLADLKQAINEVVVPVAASARKRICSRLTHLSGRIHRLNAENVDQRESLRVSRGVSKQDLFTSAGDLFKAQAWTWYNINRSRFTDWDDLVQKLRQDFLPYNYDDDLLEEINHRTQGHDEKSALFICAMEGLYNRLSKKPDEQTIVNRIRRNLLPQYVAQLALHEINTISELTRLTKKITKAVVFLVGCSVTVVELEIRLSPNVKIVQKNFNTDGKPLDLVVSTSKDPAPSSFKKTNDASKIKGKSKQSQ